MSVCRMGDGSSDPAGACAVFGYHRGRGTGFFQDRAHIFSVYGVILYKCCLQIVGIEA